METTKILYKGTCKRCGTKLSKVDPSEEKNGEYYHVLGTTKATVDCPVCNFEVHVVPMTKLDTELGQIVLWASVALLVLLLISATLIPFVT